MTTRGFADVAATTFRLTNARVPACLLDAAGPLTVHTHIDKGHIWPRRSNPDGTIASARGAVMADREANWSAADVRARMDFALRCAFANGTSAIRTHIDSYGKQTAISWPVLAEVRAAWKDRITLQAVSNYLLTTALDDEPQFRHIV